MSSQDSAGVNKTQGGGVTYGAGHGGLIYIRKEHTVAQQGMALQRSVHSRDKAKKQRVPEQDFRSSQSSDCEAD